MDSSPHWSPYDRQAPWRVRLVSRLCDLLGVEIRVETQTGRYAVSTDRDAPWIDGLAECSFPVPRDGTAWWAAARPHLYVRTAADRAQGREIDRIMRLPESARRAVGPQADVLDEGGDRG